MVCPSPFNPIFDSRETHTTQWTLNSTLLMNGLKRKLILFYRYDYYGNASFIIIIIIVHLIASSGLFDILFPNKIACIELNACKPDYFEQYTLNQKSKFPSDTFCFI